MYGSASLGTLVTEGGVAPVPVVEALDVLGDGGAGGSPVGQDWSVAMRGVGIVPDEALPG
jgi:hypothetical protein